MSGFVERNKRLLKVGFVLVVLMGAVPPWRYTTTRKGVTYESTGYAFILKPDSDIGWRSRVDVGRLMLQWIVVAASVGGLIVLRKQRHPSQEPGGEE